MLKMFSKGSSKSKSKKDASRTLSGSHLEQHAEKSSPVSSSLPRNIFSGRSRRTSDGDSSNKSPVNMASQNSHTNSAINPQVDSISSMSTSYTMGQSPGSGYMYDGYNTNPLPTSSKSPFQSPNNNRTMNTCSNTNSIPNVKAMKERYEREHAHLFMGERSLDRHVDRLTVTNRDSNGSSPSSSPRSSFNRDRSLDREYPHMGARSLEREHAFGRSRSNERPDITTQLYNNSQEVRQFRDGLILELQAQIAELNKECAKLQQEADSTKDKLSSSMNSIKTFWSPELKKERALRKEESAKYCLLNEQIKVAQAEIKVNIP